MRRLPAGLRLLAVVAEVALTVGVATAVVAALEAAVPITGLGVLYLLAVLVVAIRRGQTAALTTAVVSVLALNFFFIEPRHRLTIAEPGNVAALVVFLVVAVVVGRLASALRRRAAESEVRARIAAARGAEAEVLAGVASSLLADSGASPLAGKEERLAAALGASSARLGSTAAPKPVASERALPLPTRAARAWLYVGAEDDVDPAVLDRLRGPLARLLDVWEERRRLAEQSAEAEAARRADVAKTAILHAISHDLRSPLTAVLTASGALQGESLSPADRRELTAVVDSESRRLSALVDDLLDLSRIQADALSPRTDWCDVADAVATAAAQVAARTGDHPLDIRLPADLPLVRADAAHLERVFANLLDNAVKFSPEGVPVEVGGASGGGRVSVRVTDWGPGIAASNRRHVFEPFYRGRGARGGSGLGLTICRGFVEANGGRIRLQTAPGRGTSFVVSFPLVSQPQAVR